jgi:hypothetical protein
MSENHTAEAKITAESVVRTVSAEQRIELSKTQLDALVDAVRHDLGTSSENAADNEDRIANLAAQAHVDNGRRRRVGDRAISLPVGPPQTA